MQGNIPVLFQITKATCHDLDFLDIVKFEAEAHYIFDRGYTDFEKMFKINQSKAFFVIRAKETLAFRRLYSNKIDKATGLRCDQAIVLTHYRSAKKYPLKLRRIKYYDQDNDRYFVFLTNDFNIEAEAVAQLYKYRWQIELFFRWIKQHLKIKSFWGYSKNAVKTQICIAICSYLVVALVKKQLGIDRNLYEILQILNVTLLTKNPLGKLLSEYDLSDIKQQNEKQLSLWDS